MSFLPLALSDEFFLRLPYRVRKALGEGLVVRHKVGSSTILVPTARDLKRWKSNWMSDVLTRVCPHFPGAFLDVGVNRLQTYFALRAVDAERVYYGFEPNPACSTYAWQTFRLNPSSPSFILSCALSDSSGVLDLWVTRGSEYDSCATTVRDLRPGRDLVRLAAPAATADEMVSGLGILQIGLLKIDVEGGELAVLRGGSNTLGSMRPLVLCEVLHRDNKASAESHRRHLLAIRELLHETRHDIYQLAKSGDTAMVQSIRRIIDFENLVWTKQNSDDCDYFFCPTEKVELLEGLFRT
jgi:FkbM family methyltransferase